MITKAQRDRIETLLKLEREMVALGTLLGYLPVHKGISAALVALSANPLNLISTEAPIVSDF